MYFAQEFHSAERRDSCLLGIVLLVIGIRSVTLMGRRLALFGTLLPATVISPSRSFAAITRGCRGSLSPGRAWQCSSVAMLLMPRLREEKTPRPAPASHSARQLVSGER